MHQHLHQHSNAPAMRCRSAPMHQQCITPAMHHSSCTTCSRPPVCHSQPKCECCKAAVSCMDGLRQRPVAVSGAHEVGHEGNREEGNKLQQQGGWGGVGWGGRGGRLRRQGGQTEEGGSQRRGSIVKPCVTLAGALCWGVARGLAGCALCHSWSSDPT
jgi:hypothetical protein